MKIVNIVPGFGGTFYRGNCQRDGAFVKELRHRGHQAIILPMYLPLTMNNLTDSQDQTDDTRDAPVFYGAVSIYLKQQFPAMHKMPHWLENVFNSRPILKFAASKAASTRAQGMEALTESMLLGAEGFQREELDELVRFLKNHEKPDVVHISNVLLLGLARQIREEVKVPVVFSLQDEDVWVDAMDLQWQQRMWDLMALKARDVDAFLILKESGRFPGLRLHATGGGITYYPNTAETLANALAGILTDPLRLKTMAREGRRVVEEKYNAGVLTEKMVGLYQQVIGNFTGN